VFSRLFVAGLQSFRWSLVVSERQQTANDETHLSLDA